LPVTETIDLPGHSPSVEGDPVSKLSDRLSKAKRELDISTRQMAERAEANGYKLSDYNAKVYTNGKHSQNPDPSTLEALSYVLRVPLAEVRELAGLPAETEPFEAHASADLLTPPQRTAVNEIIRLLAESNKGAAHASQAEDQEDHHPDVSRTRDRTPMNLAEARRIREDPAAFGDQPRRGDLDQGKLQPPPAVEKSAAWRTRNRGKEIREQQDDAGDTE
jgi:transcriptional regulator with XRE-family HTH domain